MKYVNLKELIFFEYISYMILYVAANWKYLRGTSDFYLR